MPNSPVSADQLYAKFVHPVNDANGTCKDSTARLSGLVFDKFAPRLHAAEEDIQIQIAEARSKLYTATKVCENKSSPLYEDMQSACSA